MDVCSFRRSIFRSFCFTTTTWWMNGVDLNGTIVSFTFRALANPNGSIILFRINYLLLIYVHGFCMHYCTTQKKHWLRVLETKIWDQISVKESQALVTNLFDMQVVCEAVPSPRCGCSLRVCFCMGRRFGGGKFRSHGVSTHGSYPLNCYITTFPC